MISRRKLLQSSAKGALKGIAGGLVLSSLTTVGSRAQGLGTDYDIIILGAGVAGLSAAEQLAAIDPDLKVLVLEARDRIGGRIHSVNLEGIMRDAELGALYLLHEDRADWAPVTSLGLSTVALEGDRYTLAPGMNALVQSLAEASSGRVQLSSEVNEVFWREGLVGVNYRNRGLTSAVTARRLIVALPAGVLRAGGPTFNPALPDLKRQALAAIDTDQALTCAMVFPASVAKLRSGDAPWLYETDTTRLRAFLAGAEDEVLLEAQYRGSRADALKGQSDELVQGLSLRAFNDALESLPTLDTALWRSATDWGADPYSRGARSRPAGTATHLNLAESIAGTLFFAGEATADPKDVGTVHGAYDSGKRAAREAALSLGMSLDSDAAGDPNEPLFELL